MTGRTDARDLDDEILRENAVAAARGDHAFDILIRGGMLVDMVTGERRLADIGLVGPLIASVHAPDARRDAAETIDADGLFVSPGLIDTHMHVESSMITPARYAAATLPRGVTTLVWDPHELGNVHGVAGVDWAAEAARVLAQRHVLLAPSCVPSAPGLEQAGLSPDRVIHVEAGDDKSTLACMEEGLRHGGLGAVVADIARLPMTASRRLHLAAKESGTIGIALRRWRRQAEASADDVVDQHSHGFGRMRVVAHQIAHPVAQQRPGHADLGVSRGTRRAPAVRTPSFGRAIIAARQGLEGLPRQNATSRDARGHRGDGMVEPGRRHHRSPREKPASPATGSGRVVPAMARSMVRIRPSRSSAEP